MQEFQVKELDPGDRRERVVHDLASQGWSVQEQYLNVRDLGLLINECEQLWTNGCLRPAGIGKGADYQVRPNVRGDHIRWMDMEEPSEAQRRYQTGLEELRRMINRHLFLGLFEFEGHFAVYEPGARYQRHLDRFQGTEARTVTCVLYLNPGWREEDGGQLRIHFDQPGDSFMDVLPKAGTLVSFLSGKFYHEVLPGNRRRMSLTGWLKTRPETPA